MNQHTNKSKRIKRKHSKNRKQKNRRTLKNRGGLWPFTSKTEAVVQDMQSCPNSEKPCDIIDTQFKDKKNQTWKTCINMNGIYNHIAYVTQENVLVKSIESAQIPEFHVLVNRQDITCKVKIENKFVGCFLNICGEWYAIMRLFGSAILTGLLARTEASRAFYKLKNITIDFDLNNTEHGTSLISIPEGNYTSINDDFIFSFNPFKEKGTAEAPQITAIQLTEDCFENINKKNSPSVFKVLQRFRQEKILGNVVKNEAIEEGGDEALNALQNFV